MMKGATAALVLTFAVLLLIFPVVSQVSALAGAPPAWSLSFCGETITDIMQTPYPVDSEQHVAKNFTLNVYVPNVPTSIVVMLLYLVVTMAMALFIFRRKELLG